MILLFNVYIGPETRWHSYDRGSHPVYPKHEVLLATLDSYTKLNFSHVYLNIEFSPDYADYATIAGTREKIRRMKFKGPKRIRWQQAKTQLDWCCLLNTEWLNTLPYPIWVAGNHDHPYIGPPNLGDKIDTLFREANDLYMSVIYSHWSEFIDQAAIQNAERKGNFVKYPVNDVHSVRIVTPDLLRSMWFDHDYGNVELPRSDWWVGGGPWDGGEIIVKAPAYMSYTPLFEMCRHFDGYSHIGLDPHGPQGALTLPLTHIPSTREAMTCVAHQNGREVPEEWMTQF